ncbi:hypothetical protein E3O06_00855 [Cryobacterium glaciale]|uniref:Uncharacterized protein n=1 Tax=Cryobacterium glaciale TaxID=1259145 RepID=A0A4R8V608_9MICO|nr:hypothetical protein [Cryobacterium glaciale]TFB77335.1 hypothetical protein E3O06_00855 [Cryobacterium glaciale]
MRFTRSVPATVGALLLTGCAGGGPAEPIPTPTHLNAAAIDVADSDRNGIEYLSGADALRVSVRAVQQTTGVAMQTTFTQLVDPETAAAGGDLAATYAGVPDDFTSHITSGSMVVDIVVLDGQAFLQADAATSAALGLTTGGYTCRAPNDPVFDEWRTLLDPALLLESLAGGADLSSGPVAPGEPASVDVVIDSGEGSAGSLVIAADGHPLPSRLTVGDALSVADVRFSAWGTAVEVSTPTPIAQAC